MHQYVRLRDFLTKNLTKTSKYDTVTSYNLLLIDQFYLGSNLKLKPRLRLKRSFAKRRKNPMKKSRDRPSLKLPQNHMK